MAGHTALFGYSVDLMDELGRGAFGTVYKGVSDVDQTVVAMKKVSKMNKRKASMEAVRFHYMKDTIDHENIVKVYDVKSWKDSMWIMMECCDLGDLNDFYRDNQDLMSLHVDVENKALNIELTQDIAAGIAFLHSKDIVHRDIKPGNVLITTQPKRWAVAKIGDFGLSKILDPEDLTSAMSSDVGTLKFKAPEFWDRKPDTSHKVQDYHRNVDVYAAGLTFAAMLQAKPDTNLIPKAECALKPLETNMAIGLVAFTRKADVNVMKKKDYNDDDINKLVRLIQKMTRTSPKKRMSAAGVDLEVL